MPALPAGPVRRDSEEMARRCSTPADASEQFRTLAAAEGEAIPMYARLCEIIAEDPGLAGLLLEAPMGQRLPVLVLAAIHDTVLAEPDAPLHDWFPSVTGTAAPDLDPTTALHGTVERYRDRIVELVRTRQVQTNEVNRSVAWRMFAATAAHTDDRPIALVEIGASAGLNLRFDDYAIDVVGPDGGVDSWGNADSTVRLSTDVLDEALAQVLSARLPCSVAPIAWRAGIDANPLDVTDTDDARWLAACVWPEQTVRFERLRAAIDRAATDPPVVHRGDLRTDTAPLLRSTPDGHSVVVTSSWTLAYLPRADREVFKQTLHDAAGDIEGRGGSLSLLTLEPEGSLDWLVTDELPDDAPATRRHASLLSLTCFGEAGVAAVPLVRAQAHMRWVEQL